MKVPAGRFINFDHLIAFTEQKRQKENERKAAKAKSEQREKAKIERDRTRQQKERLKYKADYEKEAQAAVNAFVRIRDAGKPCVSCGKPDNGMHQRHASHFRSRGAAAHLRFNLFNIHASCSTCNCILSGNILEYLKELPNRIGQEKTDWLVNANFEKRYDIEYLKRIKSIFTRRKRLYERRFRTQTNTLFSSMFQ